MKHKGESEKYEEGGKLKEERRKEDLGLRKKKGR